jgi:molybdopterin molybdotransferase
VIPPERAWQAIEARLEPLDAERVERRAALRRVLASGLVATTEVPAADVSALDGFAYAGELGHGARLAVSVTIVAGDPPGARLEAGTAARIWTGAPVPQGADRVVGIEHTESDSDDEVAILRPVAAGAAVRRRAEILAVGAPLLAAGSRLGPAAIGLLASQGVAHVEVVRAPRVGVLATGDEVVAAEREPAPGQLRDSHTDYLLAAGRRLGLDFVALGIAGDEQGELVERIGRALDELDVVLVCGGVSMGGRDRTEAAFDELGVEVDFDAVAVQPGKPLVFGHRGRRLLFGLPGNPGSVMVAFRLFVRPALDRLAGGDAAFWSDARTLPLAAPLAAGKPRDRFVPAKLERAAGAAPAARPLGVRGSHDLATFASADLLRRVRAGQPARAAGEPVEAIEWE